MGSIKPDKTVEDLEEDEEEQPEKELSSEQWEFGAGEGSWQSKSTAVKDRLNYLHNCREMSDLNLLACDENWWFGDTVKDFTAHKFTLGASSPVLHRALYELDEFANPDRRLLLDERLKVSLQLRKGYSADTLEMDGIPPIACEALLDYIYNDKFDEAHYENGYSRNLLWRLWHASKAFEMDHLRGLCIKTLHSTMCEDTVFWDLNYSMEFKEIGTADILVKVLKLVEEFNERIFEHPNFVWLDRFAVQEVLKRRKPGSCDPIVVFNNLLRWSLYQIDRTAVSEVDEKTGTEIPIEHRLKWIAEARNGTQAEHVNPADIDKYLSRGIDDMPWLELSQKDFLEYVVPYHILGEEDLLHRSVQIMDIVVRNPGRLLNSAFHHELAVALQRSSGPSTPQTPRRVLSRTNSLRKSITDVKLRAMKGSGLGSRAGSRPTSMIAS